MSNVGACAVSHLPLDYKTQVVVFPIRKAKYDNRFGVQAYPTSYWVPVAPPVFGTYDTWGGIEQITENGNLVYQHLMEEICSGRIDYVKDRPFDDNDGHPPTDCEEMINRIWVRGKIVGGAIMHMHREIYDAAIEKVGNYVPYGKKKPWRELLTIWGRQFMETNVVLLDRNSSIEQVIDRLQFDHGNFSRQFIAGSQYDSLMPLVAKLWLTKDEALLNTLVDLALTKMVMVETRTQWSPCYAGPEDDFFNMQILIHSKAAAIMQAEKELVKADLGDDYLED